MLTIICYGVSLAVYISVTLWGFWGDHDIDYFGYGIIGFYCILPVVSFLCSLILGFTKTYWKFVYPSLFGTLGFIIPLIVFRRMSQIPLGLFFLPSVIGLFISIILKCIVKK